MKNDLMSFPFDQYSGIVLSKDHLAPFRTQAHFLLPQMMALLGNSVKLIKSADTDKISVMSTLRHLAKDASDGNILWNGMPVSREFVTGMMNILTHCPRGEILPSKLKQGSSEGVRWCALVPLVLSAFKQYKNVNYEDWNLEVEGVEYLIGKDLAKIVTYRAQNPELPWSREDLIAFREESDRDSTKPILTRTTVTINSSRDFNRIPPYLKIMLLQVWVAHPTLRHPYMLGSFKDFDKFEDSLIDSDIEVKKADDLWNSLGSDNPLLDGLEIKSVDTPIWGIPVDKKRTKIKKDIWEDEDIWGKKVLKVKEDDIPWNV